VDGGRVVLADPDVLVSSVVQVNVNGGLNITDYQINARIGALMGSGDLNLGSQLLSIGNLGLGTTYSGSISGTAESILRLDGFVTFTLTGASTYAGSTIVAGGTLLANNTSGSATGTSQVFIHDGATLGGRGAIAGQVTAMTGGTIAPGESIAALMVGGVDFQGGSSLSLELGGHGGEAGIDFDQLIVSGTATLGGQLLIELADGYTPDVMDSFTVLTADAITGSFDNVAAGGRVTTLGGEGTFLVDYDSARDQVVLSQFLPPFVLGDMDGNGVLDAFDVDDFELALADRQAYIDSHPALDPDAYGDMNASGSLDAFDVAAFEEALAADGVAVPEPGGLSLLALGGLLIGRRAGRAGVTAWRRC